MIQHGGLYDEQLKTQNTNTIPENNSSLEDSFQEEEQKEKLNYSTVLDPYEEVLKNEERKEYLLTHPDATGLPGEMEENAIKENVQEQIVTEIKTEEEAPIKILAERKVSEKDAKRALRNRMDQVHPEEISNYSFDKLVAFANDSKDSEDSNSTYFKDLVRDINKAQKSGSAVNAGDPTDEYVLKTLPKAMEDWKQMKASAAQYVKKRGKWILGGSAFTNKGKCRLALARKLKDIDFVKQFHPVPEAPIGVGEMDKTLSKKYNEQSFEMELNYLKSCTKANIAKNQFLNDLERDTKLSKEDLINDEAQLGSLFRVDCEKKYPGNEPVPMVQQFVDHEQVMGDNKQNYLDNTIDLWEDDLKAFKFDQIPRDFFTKEYIMSHQDQIVSVLNLAQAAEDLFLNPQNIFAQDHNEGADLNGLGMVQLRNAAENAQVLGFALKEAIHIHLGVSIVELHNTALNNQEPLLETVGRDYELEDDDVHIAQERTPEEIWSDYKLRIGTVVRRDQD